MRKNTAAQIWIPFLLAVSLLATAPSVRAAESDINRFNVSVIVDASGSMKKTDPHQLRFSAIRLFMSLLTEQGNVVGGVVFSTGIDAEVPLKRITGQADKDGLVEALERESAKADGQWTNIGEALMTSVQSLIRDGDQNKPSVVIFLSDGNTDMGTDREKQASMARQAEAIQLAREHNIDIYSICLNVNGNADTDEMRRISGREDLFQNVSSATDLRKTFDNFHTMIYGSSTIELIDDVFPEDGEIETSFTVPGVGVEEVNIIIYGDIKALELTRPDKTLYPQNYITRDSVTIWKITDLQRGIWRLRTEGVRKEHIRVDMKYNSDMVLDVDVSEPVNGTYTEGEKQTITLTLKSDQTPGSPESYQDFKAEALVKDTEGNTVATYPMSIAGDHFQSDMELPQGTYFVFLHVTGDYMEKMSEGTRIDINPRVNHPPVVVREVVSDTIYVLPTGTKPYQLDLKTLATDPDNDDTLSYRVVSSSFLEGDDYSVDDDYILTLRRFGRLSQGMFRIEATDSAAETCQVEVALRIRYVALMVFLGLLALGLLALLLFGLWVWRNWLRAFMGKISVVNIDTGDSDSIEPNRGRVRLDAFGIGETGLDGRCYFQATGRGYVDFIAPWPARPVYGPMSARPVRRVRVERDIDVEIFTDTEGEHGIGVYFESNMGDDYDYGEE